MLALLAQVVPETQDVGLGKLDGYLLLLGLVVPFVTAVGSKYNAPDLLKGFISVVVSAVIAYVRIAIDQDITWDVFLTGFIQVWVSALITWLGLTSDWTAKLNQITGRFGLGFKSDIPPIKTTPAPEDVPAAA